MPARRPGFRRWSTRTLLAGALVLMVGGCIHPAAPGPAILRETPPPWDAPRDAISYITAAGLAAEP